MNFFISFIDISIRKVLFLMLALFFSTSCEIFSPNEEKDFIEINSYRTFPIWEVIRINDDYLLVHNESQAEILHITNNSNIFTSYSGNFFCRYSYFFNKHIFTNGGKTWNCENPENPYIVQTHAFNHNFNPIFYRNNCFKVVNDLAFFGGGNQYSGYNLFVIFDASDLGNLFELNYFEISNDINTMAVMSDYVFLGTEENTVVLHICDYNNIEEVYVIDDLSFYNEYMGCLYIKENYLLSVSNNIRVYNIENPSNPFEIESVTTNISYEDSKIYGNNLYIAGHGDGFSVFDISIPENIILIGHRDSNKMATGIEAYSEYIYVAYDDELVVYKEN